MTLYGDFKATLVIPTLTGYLGDEIAFALRSAVNLPVDELVLIGHTPWFLKPDILIKAYDQPSRATLNTTAKMMTACLDPYISDPFIWMADDEVVLWRTDFQDLHFYRSNFTQFLASWNPGSPSKYAQLARETYELLVKITGRDADELNSYEVHGPLLVHKAPMLQALAWCTYHDKPVLKRSVYGNLVELGKGRVTDNKIQDLAQWQRFADNPDLFRFLSTNNLVFKAPAVRKWLVENFTWPSRWEL